LRAGRLLPGLFCPTVARSIFEDGHFAMTEDEQVDLVTLAWLGRGDGSLEDWNELRDEAARAHNRRTASYLLGMPLLADYLDEALAQFGHSCDE